MSCCFLGYFSGPTYVSEKKSTIKNKTMMTQNAILHTSLQDYGSPQWSPLVIAFAFRFRQTYLCLILEFVLVFYFIWVSFFGQGRAAPKTQNLKPQTLDSKISNLKLQAFLKLITLGFHTGHPSNHLISRSLCSKNIASKSSTFSKFWIHPWFVIAAQFFCSHPRVMK